MAIEFPDSYEGCITSFCDPKLFSRKFAFKCLDAENVWACFGCHPHHAPLYNAEVEAQLESLIKHPKVSHNLLIWVICKLYNLAHNITPENDTDADFQAVAWGAIGLDYSDKYGKTDHDLQQAVFRRQCELAVS